MRTFCKNRSYVLSCTVLLGTFFLSEGSYGEGPKKVKDLKHVVSSKTKQAAKSERTEEKEKKRREMVEQAWKQSSTRGTILVFPGGKPPKPSLLEPKKTPSVGNDPFLGDRGSACRIPMVDSPSALTQSQGAGSKEKRKMHLYRVYAAFPQPSAKEFPYLRDLEGEELKREVATLKNMFPQWIPVIVKTDRALNTTKQHQTDKLSGSYGLRRNRLRSYFVIPASNVSASGEPMLQKKGTRVAYQIADDLKPNKFQPPMVANSQNSDALQLKMHVRDAALINRFEFQLQRKNDGTYTIDPNDSEFKRYIRIQNARAKQRKDERDASRNRVGGWEKNVYSAKPRQLRPEWVPTKAASQASVQTSTDNGRRDDLLGLPPAIFMPSEQMHSSIDAKLGGTQPALYDSGEE